MASADGVRYERVTHTDINNFEPSTHYSPRSSVQIHVQPKTDSRVPSSTGMEKQRRAPLQKKIHPVTPTLMITSLLGGIALAIGHHFYYDSLDGQHAGSVAKQEWAARFGNAFAIAISLFLKSAVSIAYAQLLWMRLQKGYTKLETINDSFDIGNNLLGFLNFELLRRLKYAVLVAVVFWCLPIPTLLAPPTLSVGLGMLRDTETPSALSIDINNGTLEGAYAYRVSNDQPYILGPSARLARIMGAVAYAGEPLSFQLPSTQPNITYSHQATIPLLKCETATPEAVRELVKLANDTALLFNKGMSPGSLKWESNPKPPMTPTKGEIGYLGALRNYDFEGNKSSLATTASNIYTNEFVLGIQKEATTSNSSNSSSTEFLTCFLWNTTVSYTVRSTNNIARIESITQQPLHKFQPSFNVSKASGSHISYAAYAWGLSDFLLGFIGWTETQIRPSFSSQGPMLNTYMSTGSQFYGMSKNMALMGQVETALQNPANVRNVSFKEDIEAFSLNASLSLLNDPSLCTRSPVNLTSTEIYNMYTYKARDLLISYGVAIFFSLISVILGLFAFKESGVSYDTRVSSVAAAMQNLEVREALLSARISTAQPLRKQAGGIRLRFDPDEGFLGKPGAYRA